MSGAERPCDSLGLPHGLAYARLYPCGWRCERHTPSAMAGRPEPEPGPGWPPGAYLYLTPEPTTQEQEPSP